MNIFKATADFEHWLAGQLPIIRQDLALKHQQMAEAAFPIFPRHLLPLAANLAGGLH
ncbi:MAG TPA: hypothetical protein VK937_23990 [Candidatus Limnocylindria bacterium]|jgi:hypothetical protein|nr:hypothetical protein [Candidatus Limnocylindria bacterium]